MMYIKFSGHKFKCNTGAITPIRYRLKYCRNVADDLVLDFKRAAYALIYLSIESTKKPSFEKFLQDARNSSNFEEQATRIIAEMFKSEPKNVRGKNQEEDFDEVDILALYGELNLPEFLLNEASLPQIGYIINRYYNLKNKKDKPKMATNEEIKAFYGITPEREKKIIEYLKSHPQE